MEKEVKKKLEQKATESEHKAMESEQKAIESEQKTMRNQRVPDEEFSASDIECPASPASPEYEVIESKEPESEEKKLFESSSSLPELAGFTQKATQLEVDVELSELELDYSSSLEESKKNPRDLDESFVDEDVLTIDTDEEIL
jgi:hypothetical protein